ncbi:MAG TPA: host attachment protein, partial [Gemmataceae bacterium]
RLEFERNRDAIRLVLESPEARRARGMAVFSAAGSGFLYAIALGMPVEDRIVVDEDPYVVPLLETLHRMREYLVVLTDSERGELHAANPAGTRLLLRMAQEPPPPHRTTGERLRLPPANLERQRETPVLRHQKELARAIEQAWNEHDFQGIILLGPHEFLMSLRGRLPARLADRVVHQAPHDWTGKGPTLDDTARAAIDRAMQEHHDHLLEQMDERIRRGYAVAKGPAEVIYALRNDQVGPLGYVVMGPDPGEAAARCTGCRSVFVETHTACPYCGAACERTNLWQAILELALRHGAVTHFVPGDARLAPYGGVAAALSRPEPWPHRTEDAPQHGTSAG